MQGTRISRREQELNALLSSPDFSVSAYLNQALNSDEDISDSADQPNDHDLSSSLMTELALYLQIQTQVCHDDISRISAELRAILPRCAADIGRLQVGMDGMKDDAASLLDAHYKSSLQYQYRRGSHGGIDENDSEEEDECSSTSKNSDKENLTSKSNVTDFNVSPIQTLETLSALHSLSTSLSHTKKILLAASTFNTTLNGLPSLMASPSTLSQAVSSFITLQQGAQALTGLPGKEERENQLRHLKEEILIQLRPVLLHALQKMETRLGPLQTCVGMYHSMSELDCMMEEYIKSRPTTVHKLWFEFRKISGGGSGSEKNVINDQNNLDVDEFEFNSDGSHGDDDEKGEEMGKPDMPGRSTSNITANNFDSGKEFELWLPKWYEAVLILLTEERRRASMVFGAELGPEIMIKILGECFRPILSSFKSRLENICSANDTSGSVGKTSAFEFIYKIFESTVQFLSVVYEQLVDFDNSSNKTMVSENAQDQNESSDGKLSSRSKSMVDLYVLIREVFARIASPFVSYQRHLAELELHYTGAATRSIAKDIHDIVNRSDVSNMQDLVQNLASLGPSIFPHVLGSLGRFESMNSGFGAPSALHTIDSLLSKHVGEMAVSIRTLSTNLLSPPMQSKSSDSFLESFDEQQIHSALEVLKIAGIMQQNMNRFEEKTKERFRVLQDRIRATKEDELQLIDASRSTLKNNTTSILVPDTFSVAQIEVFLASCAYKEDESYNDSKMAKSHGSIDDPFVLILQRLSAPDATRGESSVQLFPKSVDSISRLIKSCQTFVFDMCSALPLKHLNDMTKISVWSQEESMWSTASAAESYGILPQSYITQVGEHMLALVQALEPFAADKDALKLANLAMQNMNHVADSFWIDFAQVINAHSDDPSLISQLRKGVDMIPFVLGHRQQSTDEGENGDLDTRDEMDGENIESEENMFCNKWLDAVCSAVTGRLLEHIIRFDRLTRKGCEHLAVDVSYMINVLSALGISGHPHPLLGHLVELVKMDPESLQTRILEQRDDVYGIRRTDVKIALMRGIAIS
jgi:conserved oligomeric Golgi complex subunit 7